MCARIVNDIANTQNTMGVQFQYFYSLDPKINNFTHHEEQDFDGFKKFFKNKIKIPQTKK
jgi:hypothetical protein